VDIAPIALGHHLEEYLVAVRLETGFLHYRSVQREKAAHRVSQRGAFGDQPVGKPAATERYQVPEGAIQASSASPSAIPIASDKVKAASQHGGDQSRHDFRRVLEVRVHHHNDLSSCQFEALFDRATEAS
jgi:hypothetical protein